MPLPTDHRVTPAGVPLRARARWRGLRVHLEALPGDVRKGEDWTMSMAAPYGYIPLSRGVDAMHLDVFLGPNRLAPYVYVIDLHRADGSFDEQKAMLGFLERGLAESCFDGHYTRSGARGRTQAVPFYQFAGWCLDRANWGEALRPHDELAGFLRAQRDGGLELADMSETAKAKQSPEAARRSNAKYAGDPGNLEKRRAKWRVQSALRSGKLKRPEKCSRCGRGGVRLQFHHTRGHSKSTSLTGRWLCRQCHVKLDAHLHGKNMSRSVKKGE